MDGTTNFWPVWLSPRHTEHPNNHECLTLLEDSTISRPSEEKFVTLERKGIYLVYPHKL